LYKLINSPKDISSLSEESLFLSSKTAVSRRATFSSRFSISFMTRFLGWNLGEGGIALLDELRIRLGS
jgi:hypothetical protein